MSALKKALTALPWAEIEEITATSIRLKVKDTAKVDVAKVAQIVQSVRG